MFFISFFKFIKPVNSYVNSRQTVAAAAAAVAVAAESPHFLPPVTSTLVASVEPKPALAVSSPASSRSSARSAFRT